MKKPARELSRSEARRLTPAAKAARRKAQKLAAAKTYYERHSARIRSQRMQRYYKQREAELIRSHAQRVKRYGCEARLSTEQWLWLLDYYGHECGYCGRPKAECEGQRLSCDCAVPLSHRGSLALGNVVPACSTCQQNKNSLPLPEWLSRITLPDSYHRGWRDWLDGCHGAFYAKLLGQPEAWAEHEQQRWGELGAPINMDEAVA